MIRKIKVIPIVLLVVLVFNSCKSQDKNLSNQCIKLNNQGINYLTNYPKNGDKGLEKAIDLFKQAINCDSTKVNFYNNLANAYDKKHMYIEELTTMNKMLLLTGNDPAILMQKGMLYEVMDHTDSARQLYMRAQSEYKHRLSKRPDDINLFEGMVLLKAVTDGKEEAITLIKEKIKIHPEHSSELSHELLFYQYFNRHDYVFRSSTRVH